jgi:hypothetical protein
MEKQKKVQVGDRNYYINTEKLLDIELNTIQMGMSRKEAKYSEFQKYLIQEGIKQVLFCTGSDEIYDDGVLYRQVSPEMIQFLKDHGLLREINQI